MNTHFMKLAFAASLLVFGPVFACGSASTASDPGVEATGTLRMPLTTVTKGATYRLVNAEIGIYKTSGTPYSYYTTYLSTSADGGAGDLTATLPTGQYTATFQTYQGWSLQVENALGQFEPVNATLTSNNTVNFTIYNDATTTISFSFQTDGVVVVVGSGTLDVGINVNQPDAACTPLGAGCGPGSWCPPASLTGMDLACVTAGSVALGSPCADPTSCVANSTCSASSDASPAVCSALCPSSGFTLPCPGGGVCQSVASDYGVCVGTSAGADDAGSDSP